MSVPETDCPFCSKVRTVTGGDFDPDWTIHPGIHWREIIEHDGSTQTYIASVLGISQQFLNNIVNGQRLPSAELTLAFAEYFEIPAEFLWQLRANYELDIARGKVEL